ncbi:TetR/AcrR family transcriptional regulator [Candidatus Mycobacterium wuenschmannii]|uniref:TetR/AcrR family transcriptional regulator n=1 Tax=Candidatus Mycobacterium wuenschmannii TaxID=3027808 RepID=A0ABY8VVJ2_9MYCO|nr:TetR/AcrR family transcriptional regulator [Candidatus Mycobacterium wuenschmannii]WIM87678.1 TetR/AcrR family transcriptional regulator [Candidatus Mycobacterium wuenschmannii]
MTAPDASTRDRLLDAAMTLFARQGYASTSIADIQQACGLSPGSGALYKHFPSKKALLQEAARRQMEQMAVMHDDYVRTRPTDVQGALRQGAEQIWASIDNNTALLRIMFREPEALGDMLDEVWSTVATTAYNRMGRALTATRDAGLSPAQDPQATASVLVAALAYLPIARMLIGHTPGNIDAEQFLEAWLRLAEGVFTGTPPT